MDTIFDLREPEPGRADGSSTADIPEPVRRELLECARHNGRISYYYLCAIYRKGVTDAQSSETLELVYPSETALRRAKEELVRDPWADAADPYDGPQKR